MFLGSGFAKGVASCLRGPSIPGMRKLIPLILALSVCFLGAEETKTAWVQLDGDMALKPDGGAFGLERRSGLHEATEAIRSAIAGPEETVVIDLRSFRGGVAAAEELAASLSRRPGKPGPEGKGKRVLCLLDEASDASLVVAKACDEVIAIDGGFNTIDGISLEIIHFTGGLEKLGITFHAVASGPEKTAHEPLTRLTPSDAAKAQYRKELEGLDRALIAASVRPGLDAAKLRALRAISPQTGVDLVAMGIATQAVEPGAWRRSLPQPIREVSERGEKYDFSNLTGLMQFWAHLMNGPNKVNNEEALAVVELEGNIVGGPESNPGQTIAEEDTVKMLQDLEEDHRIKAVVLRINSGGGDAGASDRIYHAVKRLDAVKPVIALFDSVAASGGYYIGCGAREIVVHRATITGSIGVFALVPDFQGTCDKLGLSTFVINSDPRADLFSGLGFTAEKEKALGKIITDVDQRFQGVVAKARKMSSASIATLANGKVYIGEEAIALGLADRLGTLADTAARARTLAGFTRPLPVERYPEPQGFMRVLERLGGASADNLPKVAAKFLGGHFAATLKLLSEPSRVKILAWTQTPVVR